MELDQGLDQSNQQSFLSSFEDDECDWDRQAVSCNQAGRITAITTTYSGSKENLTYTGVIPPELAMLTALEMIVLDGNELPGNFGDYLPIELAQLIGFTQISFRTNLIRGALPGVIGSFSALQYFDVSENVRYYLGMKVFG